MALSDDVKDELLRIRATKTTARSAELAAILRFAGGLQVISGRMAVEAEVDSELLARRLRRELRDIYGAEAVVTFGAASSQKRSEAYVVRVLEQGETLARQTGLLDSRRRPVRGLPNKLTTGSKDDVSAIWRGAFLAAGTLTEPGRSASLEIMSPNNETALALVGAAARVGVAAKARELRGTHRVIIRDSEAIAALLGIMGARAGRTRWEELRTKRETRAAANRLVNFDDANLRRSAQAAVAACARVERAMEILGDDVPKHLRYAGELRLQFREASLDELGQHADPPMSKDAVAGRIRRLLAMADKEAQAKGIPNTESGLSLGFDV